jgi:hypothetical protein
MFYFFRIIHVISSCNIDSKKGKTKIVAIYLKWNFLKSSKIDMGWKCSTVKNVKITI